MPKLVPASSAKLGATAVVPNKPQGGVMLKRFRTPGATRFGLALLVGLLLTASFAFAQVTGEIRGQVKAATTAGDGTYRIPLVPPGEYAVTFGLAGFGKVEKRVAVQLDKTVVVDAALALATTAEVTVSGEAPVIDATSSATGANFTADMVKT